MSKSQKSILIGVIIFIVLLIVGLIVAGENWGELQFSELFYGKDKATELDNASYVVTGHSAGMVEHAERGNKALIGLGIMVLGACVLVTCIIIAIPNKKKHADNLEENGLSDIQSNDVDISVQNNDVDVLEKLAHLHDSGILSDEEYQSKKEEILRRI